MQGLETHHGFQGLSSRGVVQLVDGRMYFDADTLLAYAHELRAAYLQATPYPHIVIDNLFPESVLIDVVRDFPSVSEGIWKHFNDPRHVKRLSQGDAGLAPSIRHVLAQLRTSEFISFLEVLSGMEGLVSDPHTGGCHETPPGGYLDVHVDASWNERLALYTGINVFLYLNRDWADEYGGHLELWDERGEECRTRILPIFNRMVIFTSGEKTYHGHPSPLSCPAGLGRKSLAANFCVSRHPEHQTQFRRSAIYRANPERSRRVSIGLLAEMWMAPIVAETLRRARSKLRRSTPA